MKYSLEITNSFKRDYKKLVKRNYDLSLLNNVVDKLQNGEKLNERYKNHNLSGEWTGFQECHILPDWLLIYKVYDDKLILSLTRTGTHSDLF